MSDFLDTPKQPLKNATKPNNTTPLKSLAINTELPDSMHAYKLAQPEKKPGHLIKQNIDFYYKYSNNRSVLSSVTGNIYNENHSDKIGTDSMAYNENGLLDYCMKKYKKNTLKDNYYSFNFDNDPMVFFYEEKKIHENKFQIQQKILEHRALKTKNYLFNYNLFYTVKKNYYNTSGNLDSVIYIDRLEYTEKTHEYGLIKDQFYTRSFYPLDTLYWIRDNYDPITKTHKYDTVPIERYFEFFPQYEKYLYRINTGLEYKYEKKLQYSNNFDVKFDYTYTLQKTETLETENQKKTIVKYIDSRNDEFSGIDTLTDEAIENMFSWSRIYEMNEYYNVSGNLDSAYFNYQVKETYINANEYFYTVDQYKVYYTYNEKGLVSDIVYYDRSTEENVWSPFSKMYYYYTPKGSLLQYEKYFVHDLKGEWVLEESEKYFYPGLPTHIDKNAFGQHLNTIAVFPNPVLQTLYLHNINNVFYYEIIDLNGTLVLTGIGQNSQIDVTSLKQGFYILRILSENHTYTTRFVKSN